MEKLDTRETMENLTPISSAKISVSNDTLLIYLPRELERLLKLKRGEYLQILADEPNQEIVMRKTGFFVKPRREKPKKPEKQPEESTQKDVSEETTEEEQPEESTQKDVSEETTE